MKTYTHEFNYHFKNMKDPRKMANILNGPFVRGDEKFDFRGYAIPNGRNLFILYNETDTRIRVDYVVNSCLNTFGEYLKPRAWLNVTSFVLIGGTNKAESRKRARKISDRIIDELESLVALKIIRRHRKS